MTNFGYFRPDPSLEISVQAEAFDAPVSEVNEHLLQMGKQYFFDAANEALAHNESHYAVVGGGDDRSSEMAILLPSTFGNGLWPHMFARAEAVAHMAQKAGIHDTEGNLVPVILTASPSMENKLNLKKDERELVRHGDYSPLARRQIGLSYYLGFDAVRGVVGMSQAATLAAPIAEHLQPGHRADGFAAVLIEPPHARKRLLVPTARQLVNFGREGTGFKPQLMAEDITVINQIFETGQASPDFIKGIFKEGADNYAIVRGFAWGNLQKDLCKLALRHVTTTVIHGSDSFVANRDDVANAVLNAAEDVRDHNGTTWPHINNLRRLELIGTNHSFGDRVGRFATVVAANLIR